MTQMLRGLIEAFMTGTYQDHRMGADGTYVEGNYVPGRKATLRIRGSLQPLSPREVLQLPEGERVRASWKLYTDGTLITSREAGERQADTVVIRGEEHKVMSVERWEGTAIPYWKAILARVQPESEHR